MSVQPFSVFPSLMDSVFSYRFSRIDKLFSQLTGDIPVTSVPAYDLLRVEDNYQTLTVSAPGRITAAGSIAAFPGTISS